MRTLAWRGVSISTFKVQRPRELRAAYADLPREHDPGGRKPSVRYRTYATDLKTAVARGTKAVRPKARASNTLAARRLKELMDCLRWSGKGLEPAGAAVPSSS